MTTPPTTYPFLSDEWRAAVRDLKAEYLDNPVVEPGLVINATITHVPFGDGTLELHSEAGPVMGWELGHIDGAVVALEIEYHMAKALVLDQTFDALEQEVASGALKIEGEPGNLRRWWGNRIGNPGILELEDRIRSITA
jgi:hypothetical protein